MMMTFFYISDLFTKQLFFFSFSLFCFSPIFLKKLYKLLQLY